MGYFTYSDMNGSAGFGNWGRTESGASLDRACHSSSPPPPASTPNHRLASDATGVERSVGAREYAPDGHDPPAQLAIRTYPRGPLPDVRCRADAGGFVGGRGPPKRRYMGGYAHGVSCRSALAVLGAVNVVPEAGTSCVLALAITRERRRELSIEVRPAHSRRRRVLLQRISATLGASAAAGPWNRR